MINFQLIRSTIFIYDLSEGYYNMTNIQDYMKKIIFYRIKYYRIVLVLGYFSWLSK